MTRHLRRAARATRHSPQARSPLLLLLVGVLVGVLGLVLAACSGTDDGADAATTTTPTTQAPTTAAPTTAAPTTAAPTTAAPTTAAPTTTERVPDIEPVVFADDFGTSVAPIFAARCASCHEAGGPGSVHWPLETAADVAAYPSLLRVNLEDGVMPPWPAGGESVAFHDDRSLRDDELAAILAWMDAGAPLDVPSDTPIEPAVALLDLPRIDTEIAPAEPYDGTPGTVDDYRCLVYDPAVDEPTWITGYEFVPDQTEVVHHALGYLVGADQRARADALAAEDPGGGWECFGGSRLRGDQLFLGWAPGQSPSVYPDGAGLLLEPGDFVVVQIHYHFEIDAPTDASTVRLMIDDGANDLAEIEIAQYVAPAEIPCASWESGPLCDRDTAKADAIERFGQGGVQADGINLLCRAKPADFAAMTDGLASSSCDLPIYGFGEIVSVLGHEHEIGASFRMTLNPGKDDERILLDIPDWDFDWQYNYEPVETIVLVPGDTVRIECSWDRRLRDPDLEPRYILWADGTNDEMCFSTIVTKDVG